MTDFNITDYEDFENNERLLLFFKIFDLLKNMTSDKKVVERYNANFYVDHSIEENRFITVGRVPYDIFQQGSIVVAPSLTFTKNGNSLSVDGSDIIINENSLQSYLSTTKISWTSNIDIGVQDLLEVSFDIDKTLENLSSEIRLDEIISNMGVSEKEKVKSFFTQVADQPVFFSDDHLRLRNMIIDWHSTQRTLITKNKNLTNIYSLTSEELNELILGFGFPYPNQITGRNNKASFLQNLFDFYKSKGTPDTLIKVLGFFGLVNVSLSEWWIHKDKSNKIIAKTHPVAPIESRFDQDYYVTLPYSDFVKGDPYWKLKEESFYGDNGYLNTNKITLPSITPIISFHATADMTDINRGLSILHRKAKETFDFWVKYVLRLITETSEPSDPSHNDRYVELYETPVVYKWDANDDKWVEDTTKNDTYFSTETNTHHVNNGEEWVDLKVELDNNRFSNKEHGLFRDIQLNIFDFPEKASFFEIMLLINHLFDIKHSDEGNRYVKYSPEIDSEELEEEWESYYYDEYPYSNYIPFDQPVIATRNIPPDNPNDGDSYLIGDNPENEWVGEENRIATWNESSSEWVFSDKQDSTNQDNILYSYSGTEENVAEFEKRFYFIKEKFNDFHKRPQTREERDLKYKLYKQNFTTETDYNNSYLIAIKYPETYLKVLNPSLLKATNNKIEEKSKKEILHSTLVDFEDYLKTVLQISDHPLSFLTLGPYIYRDIKNVIDYFKPIRTRIRSFITTFNLEDPLSDSIIPGDALRYTSLYALFVDSGDYSYDDAMVSDNLNMVDITENVDTPVGRQNYDQTLDDELISIEEIEIT
ncbi:MAG: DUF2793 domain-containing protein [archaeon]